MQVSQKMGDNMRQIRPSVQNLRHYQECLLFPHSLSVYIRLDPAPARAFAARDAIETAWARTGRWIGHGTSLQPDGECDVQVCFRTPEDVAAAKETAAAILREAGLARFRFAGYSSSPEDCANLYGIPAAALIPNRVFPNAPSLPNAPSRQNPSSP